MACHIGGQPLTRHSVRSLITWPQTGNTVAPGEAVVRGLAWSGAGPITQVEVRVGGRSWQTAILTGDRNPHGWRSWHLPAWLEEPDRVIIRARAADIAGLTQPARPTWNPLGYAANPIHQVRINVRHPSHSQRSGAAACGPAQSRH